MHASHLFTLGIQPIYGLPPDKINYRQQESYHIFFHGIAHLNNHKITRLKATA